MTTTHSEYLALVQKASDAAKAYYDEAKLLMSDEEYDDLIDRIEYLSEENGWTEGDALIEAVAAGVSAGGDVKHLIPMLSLGKANTLEGVKQFLSTVKGQIVVEPKFDGLAISAIYRNGRLTQVSTRGDGSTGEDITARSVDVHGLPSNIPFLSELEVRGEVFITVSDFDVANLNRLRFSFDEWRKSNKAPNVSVESLYKVARENRQLPKNKRQAVDGKRNNGTDSKFYPDDFIFANERNAIAGSLRNESRDYEVPMSFACYDVYGDNLSNLYSERLAQVSDYGISTARSYIVQVVDTTNPLEALNEFGEIRKAKKLAMPTDGIVFKADAYTERGRLGEGNKSPKWAIAYKYPSEHSESVLLGIEPTIGRTGRLALRARIKPVLVDGTRIEYVSLHNVSWVQEHDLRLGDTVLVRRANDVIPYVDGFVADKRPINATRWVAPEVCPQCGSEWDKTTLLWRCTSPSCGELNGIIFAAGRDYFDWEGLSEAILTRLNDEDKVHSVSDVFKLTESELANLFMGRYNKDGEKSVLGETVAKKIYQQIQESKTRPFAKVLAALGIRSLGRTFGRTLAARYGSMAELLKASKTELASIEGIGEKKADMIYDGLREKIDVIKELYALGVNLADSRPVSATVSRVKGLKIVVSGNVPGYTRTTIQDKIAELGGVPSSSVSSSTNILVAGDDMTGNSKYQKAAQLGVKIVDPTDFLEWIK